MSQIRNIVSKNPFSGETLKKFKFTPDAQLEKQLQLSREAFQKYKTYNYKERSDRLLKLSYNIEQNVNYYADILAEEMGAPIAQGRLQVQKSAQHCKYYAEHLERFLKQTRIKTEAKNSGIIYEPLGIIHLMIPFNYPFWLTFKAGIPILAAGNTILMRNSDSTPILAEELERLFKISGFDNNEFQNVYSHPNQLDTILGNRYVQGVSFTGSTRVGKIIASTAGQHLKKCLLELGGSDPFIVRMDADVEKTVELAIKSRLLNSGQTCISAKRFLIHDNVYEKFVEQLLEKLQDQKVGNPLHLETTVGPMARLDLKESLDKQVQQGIDEGAKVLYQHDVDGLPSTFYPPTVLEIEDKNNSLFQEETFGPVFVLYKVANDQEAVQIANESIYGLGGSVHSRDTKEAEKIARQIETGMVFINDIVKSDTRLPAGGCKESGYGRECSDFGIKEFTNVKTYYIA